jgi:hypothetical protein
MTFRQWMYLIARVMGDINALFKGPRGWGTRYIRKSLYKLITPKINKIK